MYTAAQIAIDAVYREFKAHLSSTLRYARYMTMETPEEWAILLGPDVVLLTHGEFTADVARQFCTASGWGESGPTPNDQQRLHIAALIHDWGEIVIGSDGVGDISFDQKTSSHEEVEALIFYRIVDTIGDMQVEACLKDIYREVVLDRNSRLGQMFNAIERLGYLHTAVRAFLGVNGGQRITNWRGLVGNVLSNQIESLLGYAQSYPGVTDFLTSHAQEISQMWDEVTPHPTPLDRDGNASFDREKLERVHAEWSHSPIVTSIRPHRVVE